MFENKVAKTGIHYSRYIASFAEAGGNIRSFAFAEWLEELGLDKEEILEIRNLAWNGKMELEDHAKKWLKEKYPHPIW